VSTVINIPVSEPTIRPPKGNPGSVDAFARTLYAAASRLEEFGDLAAEAKNISTWLGKASEAYSGAAGRASGEHATLATTIKRVYQSARYRGDGSSVASMMWLGYDAPDSFADTPTLTESRAEDGGGRFSDTIDGLRASRPGDDAHITIGQIVDGSGHVEGG